MNRDMAIAIAKQCAAQSAHNYTKVPDFEPHDWAVQCVMRGAEHAASMTQTQKPLAWIRHHPDGTPTGEVLADTDTRMSSVRREPAQPGQGGWLPLFAQVPGSTDDDLAGQIKQLRADLQSARADGRSEAAAIIMKQSADDPLADCIDSGPLGDTGDYEAYWLPSKLHELLKCSDRAHSAIEDANGEMWHYQSLRMDAKAGAARNRAIEKALTGVLAALPYTHLADVDLAAIGADPLPVSVLAARQALAMQGDGVRTDVDRHDNLRDRIGQLISSAIAENPGNDWCDAREVDFIADAVLEVVRADFAQASSHAGQKQLHAEIARLTQWKHCMSYNDSYFGEPEGLVKRIAYELDRLLPSAPTPSDLPLDFLRATGNDPENGLYVAIYRDGNCLPVELLCFGPWSHATGIEDDWHEGDDDRGAVSGHGWHQVIYNESTCGTELHTRDVVAYLPIDLSTDALAPVRAAIEGVKS